MKTWKKLVAVLLSIVVLTGTVVFAETSDESIQAMIEDSAQTLSFMEGCSGYRLANQTKYPAGNSSNDWTAYILAVCGSREYYAEYLDALQKYVEQTYAENGYLHNVKATEYHRTILTVKALGGDPQNFGLKPDGTNINLLADGTYNFVGTDLGVQGLNGWIWALITVDACAAEIPKNAVYSREQMAETIIRAQEPDGGFGLEKGKSDVDITAMALQALAPYVETYNTEVTNALNWLSLQINDDCTIGKTDSYGSESISQIIMALCALGIDPEETSAFTRGDNTLLTALEKYRKPDASYSHLRDDENGDSMATVQALEALVSVSAMRKGLGYVFSSANIIFPNQNTDPVPAQFPETEDESETVNDETQKASAQKKLPEISLGILIPIVAVIVIIILFAYNRYRKNVKGGAS